MIIFSTCKLSVRRAQMCWLSSGCLGQVVWTYVGIQDPRCDISHTSPTIPTAVPSPSPSHSFTFIHFHIRIQPSGDESHIVVNIVSRCRSSNTQVFWRNHAKADVRTSKLCFPCCWWVAQCKQHAFVKWEFVSFLRKFQYFQQVDV